MCLVSLSCLGIRNCVWNPQNISGTTNSRPIPQFVSGIRINLRTFYICGTRLHMRNPELLTIFARCGIRNKTNEPTKFSLKVFVCGIHGNVASEIHLHFGKRSKTCLWIPGTYKHKIVRLSTAQFGLVMTTNSCAISLM